jgi:hypothetical protein
LDHLHYGGLRASPRIREFAVAVGGPRRMTLITWRYQLEPSGAGTDVTESFEVPDTP